MDGTIQTPAATDGALVGEPLKKALSSGDLMRALGMKRSAFALYQKQGRFKRFELPRAIGSKKYSGRLVEAYLAGGK